MKISVERDILNNILKKAQSCVSRRDSIPILKNFLVQVQEVGDEKEMRVIGSDSSLGVLVVNRIFRLEEGGKVALPADKLIDIVSEVDTKVGNDIEKIDFSCDDLFCDINSSKTHWRIKCNKADDYPDVPRYEVDKEVVVVAPKFLNALRKLRRALPEVKDKAKLLMVHFENGWGYSTDSHRIQAVAFEGLDGIDVTSSAVPDLIQLLETNVPKEVGVVVTDNFILFRIKNDIYHCAKVQETFPDVGRVVNDTSNFEKLFEVDRMDLVSAVRRVRIASDKDSRKIILSVSADGLKVSSKDIRGDLCDEEVTVNFVGSEPRELLLDWKHLLDMLETIEEGKIVFKLGADSKNIKSPIRVEEKDSVGIILQFKG